MEGCVFLVVRGQLCFKLRVFFFYYCVFRAIIAGVSVEGQSLSVILNYVLCVNLYVCVYVCCVWSREL